MLQSLGDSLDDANKNDDATQQRLHDKSLIGIHAVIEIRQLLFDGFMMMKILF